MINLESVVSSSTFVDALCTMNLNVSHHKLLRGACQEACLAPDTNRRTGSCSRDNSYAASDKLRALARKLLVLPGTLTDKITPPRIQDQVCGLPLASCAVFALYEEQSNLNKDGEI